MNNAKMWLVVKPTVGVPLFLSAVAIGSFAVHVAVLTNTGWVGDFLTGVELGSSAMVAEDAVVPASYTDGMTVTLPDGTLATLTLEPTATLASAD